MIKTFKLFVFIGLIIFLSPFYIQAQPKAKIQNNIVVWGKGGYSALLIDKSNINSIGNIGGGLGIGYELQYKKFSMQTGVDFTYSKSAFELNQFVVDIENLYDDEGDKYTGHWTFSENYDRYKLGDINIPLLFGARFNKAYFLAGAKLGINVMGNSTTEAYVKKTGTYDKFIGVFEDMPNHNFGTSKEVAEYPISLSFNCSASAEFGIYLGNKKDSKKKNNPSYRLAAFCDYGLLNVNNYKNEELVLNRSTNEFIPYLNNFMFSNNMKTNTFFTGIKFTVLFKMKERQDCKCDIPSKKKKK